VGEMKTMVSDVGHPFSGADGPAPHGTPDEGACFKVASGRRWAGPEDQRHGRAHHPDSHYFWLSLVRSRHRAWHFNVQKGWLLSINWNS
jgi:hypothetical protein